MATDFPETNPSFPFDSCNLLLGKGGSGAVFLARHHETRQLVAVKRCYARRGDHEQPPSTTAFPYSPTAVFHESVPRATSPTVHCSAFTFHNELEMREESNLEVVSALLPPPPPPSQRPGEGAPQSPSSLSASSRSGADTGGTHSASPESSPRVDETMMLEYIGKHPYIVDYLGSYTSSRRVRFFAMELMDSDVGRELRSGNTALRSEEACAVIGFHMLEALQHIHRLGVAHRDVKPGNIFLKRVASEETAEAVLVSGTLKAVLQQAQPPSQQMYAQRARDTGHGVPTGLNASSRRPDVYVKAHLGDFSAAHLVNQQTMDSTTLATRGTLFYKSPEQLLGRPIYDFTACDMWALGCTLLEMITGAVPFAGTSELQVLMEMLHRLGSNFTDYPSQPSPITLFDAIGTIPQAHRLADLLTHLLALDPTQRYTAAQALEHPFFATLRQRRQHMAVQLRALHPQEQEEGADSERAGDDVSSPRSVPILLKARLMSTRCPESAQLRVSFRPVAITPFHKRQRAEQDRAEVDHFVSFARREAAQRHCGMHREEDPHIRGGPQEGAHGSRGASQGHGRPSRLSHSPFDGNSFLSDGPSLHWSQVRSFIVGGSGEVSDLADAPSSLTHHQSYLHAHSHVRNVDDEAGVHPGDGVPEDGRRSGSDRSNILMRRSASKRSGGVTSPQEIPSEERLAIRGLSFSGRLSQHSGPLFSGRSIRPSASASPQHHVPPPETGSCGRPVLFASSGTAFTASNLRAYHDFERSLQRDAPTSGGESRVTGQQASFRALTYSSEEAVLSPSPRTGPTSLNASSSGEQGEGKRLSQTLAGRCAPRPKRACKMLLFESPQTLPEEEHGSGSSGPTACTPNARPSILVKRGPLQTCTRSGHAEDDEQICVEEADEVDASAILGQALSSPLSNDMRSCCSSVTATPLGFFRTAHLGAMESATIPETLAEGGSQDATQTTAAFSPAGSVTAPWSPGSAPVDTVTGAVVVPPFLCPASQERQPAPLTNPPPGAFADTRSVTAPVAGISSTRRPSLATPTLATLSVARSRPMTLSCSSLASSSSPSAVLQERNVNTSGEVVLSALCSPLPRHTRQDPRRSHQTQAQLRLQRSLPLTMSRSTGAVTSLHKKGVHMWAPGNHAERPTELLCNSPPFYRDPVSTPPEATTPGGTNETDAGEMPSSLSLSTSTSPAVPQQDVLLRELADALNSATSSTQHMAQQRHCTPSLEPASESATTGAFDSCERSASALVGVVRNLDSTPDVASEASEISGSSRMGRLPSTALRTPTV